MTWEQEVQLSYHRGIAEGVEKGRKETAIKMLEDGYLPLERISEYTQLSVEELKALQLGKQNGV